MKKLLLMFMVAMGFTQELSAMDKKENSFVSISSLYNDAKNDVYSEWRVLEERNNDGTNKVEKISGKKWNNLGKYGFIDSTDDQMVAVGDSLDCLSLYVDKEETIDAQHWLLLKQLFSVNYVESRMVQSVKEQYQNVFNTTRSDIGDKIQLLRSDQAPIRHELKIENPREADIRNDVPLGLRNEFKVLSFSRAMWNVCNYQTERQNKKFQQRQKKLPKNMQMMNMHTIGRE